MTAKSNRHQAWTRKKRLAVMAALSLGILLVSLVIGGGLYLIGRKAGLVRSQSIETLTKEALMSDPAFMAALEKSAKTRICENTEYRISLEYFEPLEPLQYTGTKGCLVFRLMSNPDAQQPVVEIRSLPTDKQVALGDMFRDLANVETRSFPHNRYAVTKVIGLKQDLEYWGYVVPIDDTTTWVVSFSPVTQRAAEAVEHLVGSFQVLSQEPSADSNQY